MPCASERYQFSIADDCIPRSLGQTRAKWEGAVFFKFEGTRDKKTREMYRLEYMKWGLLIGVVASACSAGHHEVPLNRLKGVWHEVSKNDTIASISKQYRVEERHVLELNDLPDEQSLLSRNEIFIPKTPGVLPGEGLKRVTSAPQKAPQPIVSPAGEQCRKNNTYCLSWPVDGPVVRSFEKNRSPFHDGIDISSNDGAAIYAAKDGKVLYSGDDIDGYGNMIIVRHENNMITVYAHNKLNMVEEGQDVTARQKIAEVGKTGGADKTHLHFELRIDEKPMDPIPYLDKRKRSDDD